MASTADFRNGMVLEIDGDLWAITYFQHVKPGKGGAFVRTKLKNVLSGAVVDRTYRAGEKVTDVRLERRPVTYSYTDGLLYYFMDAKTFDMIPIAGDLLGEEQLQYLKENMACEGLVHDDKVISVELPQFVELAVTETDPGLQGRHGPGRHQARDARDRSRHPGAALRRRRGRAQDRPNRRQVPFQGVNA